jgi:magnesium transporter
LVETELLEPWKELVRLTDEGRSQALEAYLDELPSGDVALAVSRLTDEEQLSLLAILTPEAAADLVEQLPDVQAVELFEQLEPADAAAILLELPSNERADLLGDLDEPKTVAILNELSATDAADARELSRYADDVAGGLMVTEVLKYSEHVTVEDVVADMREQADRYRDYDVQYTYVCDAEDRLSGVLRLRDLLLAKRKQPIGELMIRQPLSLRDDTPLTDLGSFFGKHHYLGVPIVNGKGQLVGVVRKTAVAEALGERNDSDFLKAQGIIGGEELRTLPTLVRARRRLAWLTVNIGLNVVAASVIAVFQDTLSSVIALAVFLPIISDMSGCSGNQAVAVSMRELSLGLVRAEEVVWVWLKEIAVGVTNGTVLGLLIGVVAFAWKGNLYLSLVVGVALCLNTILAVSIGGVVPLVLKRRGMDPAVASGPILTTITDVVGFFLVLGFATLMLARLH